MNRIDGESTNALSHTHTASLSFAKLNNEVRSAKSNFQTCRFSPSTGCPILSSAKLANYHCWKSHSLLTFMLLGDRLWPHFDVQFLDQLAGKYFQESCSKFTIESCVQKWIDQWVHVAQPLENNHCKHVKFQITWLQNNIYKSDFSREILRTLL